MIVYNNEIFQDEYELLGFKKAQSQAQKIKKNETLRKCKPTKSDYKELKQILKDFGYKISNLIIPDFNTKAEMEMWQKQQIHKILNSI